MRRQEVLLVAVSLVWVLVHGGSAWAWSVLTHEVLSEQAAQVSTLNSRVLTGLGFQNLDTRIAGIDFNEKERTQEIRFWIQGGSAFEDAGNPLSSAARFNNHFHNPLNPWPQAGLNDLRTGESALLWAQNAVANPNWSWQGVRQSYYQALTLEQKGAREAQFARVFAGLGHVIHLIQDMAQTAHVRNDAHPIDALHLENGMETWAINSEETNGLITAFAQVPVFPSLSQGAGSPPDEGFEPITDFWDTDQYDGLPGTTATAKGLTVGLAEYTNANYFSEDTIASTNPDHQFPYPSVNITDYRVCADDAPTGSRGLKRWYISRSPGPCPAVPDHFLAESATRNVLGPQPHAITKAFTLDDKVMEDYARDLIPRAVGYSAKLIDYFFRGQLDVEPVDATRVRVINRSEEPLYQGTLKIFYDTRVQQKRVRLATATLAAPLAPGQATSPITFEQLPPSDPTNPDSNITPGRYRAVFQGMLGAEEQGVIGISGFGWAEEWDQGLIGRHPWYFTVLDANVAPPVDGERDVQVVDTPPSATRLRMRNMRPAGVPGSQIGDAELFQGNAAWLGYTSYPSGTDPAQHYDAFPIQVLPETELQIKVAVLSTTFPTPLQQCLVAPYESWHNGAFQHVVIGINYGAYVLELTVPGQQVDTRKVGPSDGLLVVTPGQEQQINLWQALRDSGAPVDQQAMVISSIRMEQTFLPSCQTTTSAQEQIMEIDYLRLVDAPADTL